MIYVICLYVVKRNRSSVKLSFSLGWEVLRTVQIGWSSKGVLIVRQIILKQIEK